MYTVVDRKKAYYGDTLKKSFSLISHLRLYIFHSYFNSYSSFYCRERIYTFFIRYIKQSIWRQKEVGKIMLLIYYIFINQYNTIYPPKCFEKALHHKIIIYIFIHFLCADWNIYVQEQNQSGSQ